MSFPPNSWAGGPPSSSASAPAVSPCRSANVESGHGIDLSQPWSRACRAKPEPKTSGSPSATSRRPGSTTFGLAYLVFNTIENLTSQDDQVACFGNVAAHLDPGGCFVIEVEVPQLQRLPPGETVRAFTVTPKHLGFDAFDLARVKDSPPTTTGWRMDRPRHLGAVSLCVALRAGPDGATRRHEAARTMEQLVREPFTSDSSLHISVWEKAENGPA